MTFTVLETVDIFANRKRGNCECIATWGRLTPRQSFSALITTPWQVWSRWSYPLPYCSVFAADTLLYAVTLTFGLWPWTFVVYRLWRDETLYQIWTQSSNLRRSYCDFHIWPNDLERHATCCARRWNNFHQVWPSTTYPCLNYGVFWCHAVTLNFDLLTLSFYSTSGVMRLNSVQNSSEIE